MFPKINPTNTNAWKSLENHLGSMKKVQIKELFAKDPDRFKKWSFSLEDILLDFSKNICTEETKKLLQQLASECKLAEAIKAMFEGELINETEHRSVLHVALRNFSGKPMYSSGKNVMEDVQRVQQQMKDFCRRIHTGEW